MSDITEREVVDALFGRFERLCLLLQRFGVPSSSVEDAAQEVLIGAIRRLREGLSPPESLVPTQSRLPIGVVMLARQTASNRRRSLARRPEVLQESPESADESQQHGERQAMRQLLALALDRLSDSEREVLVLREVEGHSTEEVAEVLGIPEGTVKSTLSRAKERLRAALDRLEGVGGTS